MPRSGNLTYTQPSHHIESQRTLSLDACPKAVAKAERKEAKKRRKLKNGKNGK